MANEKAFICVHCGYNTLTREVGKLERTYSLTFEEQLKHLSLPWPGVAVAFALILFLIWFCIVYPTIFRQGWKSWLLGSEPIRLFLTIFTISFIYKSGYPGLHKIIFEPKPKERKKD